MSDVTLRDQFALAALQAALTNEDTQRAIRALCTEHNERLGALNAGFAYEIADHMMKAREKK